MLPNPSIVPWWIYMYPSWNTSAISRGTLVTTLHVIQPDSSVIFFCTDSFPARGLKNIVSGLKARWEELLSKETVVDKEGLIAHQEGFIHPPQNISRA